MTSTDGGLSHGTLTVRHPFDTRSLFAADLRGRWVYVGTWRAGADRAHRFELLQLASSTDTMAVAYLPFPRPRVARSDIEAHAERVYADLPENIRSRLSERELVEQMVRQVARPTRSVIDAMVAGDDETIWFRQRTGDRKGASSKWAAYRFGEGFVGVAVLPEGHALLAQSGGLLWTTSRDALGLPAVTGWSVSWSKGSE